MNTVHYIVWFLIGVGEGAILMDYYREKQK